MKKEQQILIIIGIIFLAVLFIYFKFMFIPLTKQIAEVKKNISEKKAKLDEMKMIIDQLPLLRQEKEKLNLQIAELEKKLPAKPNIPELIKIITKESQYYNVKITNFVTNDIVTEKKYCEVPFRINFTTSYHNFALFVTDISQTDRIFAIRDLSLNYNPSAEKENNLNGTCIIFSYTQPK